MGQLSSYLHQIFFTIKNKNKNKKKPCEARLEIIHTSTVYYVNWISTAHSGNARPGDAFLFPWRQQVRTNARAWASRTHDSSEWPGSSWGRNVTLAYPGHQNAAELCEDGFFFFNFLLLLLLLLAVVVLFYSLRNFQRCTAPHARWQQSRPWTTSHSPRRWTDGSSSWTSANSCQRIRSKSCVRR